MLAVKIVSSVLLVLPVLTSGASVKPIPDQMKYIGIGYDIIKGNPEGNKQTGGVDPGLLTTRRVLQLTYDQGKTSNDNQYRIPDEVEYTKRSSSFTSKETDSFYGTKSYAKKLSHQVSVDVGVEAVFASFMFSASHKYQSISEDEKTTGYVYFSEQTIENYGDIRYLTKLAGPDGFEVDREFRVAVCGLPTTYNQAAYMEFFSNWGTHVVKEAALGVRSGTTYREDKSSFIKSASTDMSNSVSVGGSYKIVSASLSVNMDKLTKSDASEKTVKKEYSQYTVGSKEHNEPISIKLVGLNEALDSVFWSKQQEYEANGDCPSNWPRATIQENIMTAFSHYPTYLKVPESSDKDIMSVTITWPDGKYALPEAATLPTNTCPEAEGMSWSLGLLYQDTDKAGANTCSRGNHLTNYCEADKIRTYYCVKTTEKATPTSWQWLPGVYCIFKYGNTCPDGFTEGSITWNDENRGVDPIDFTTMPSGTYSGGPTSIDFCCREDGSTANPIILPTSSSFYLLKFHDSCQQVLGMTAEEEFLEWSTKQATPTVMQSGTHPLPGNTGHNVKIYYCFYRPNQSAKRSFGELGKSGKSESDVKKELEEVRELLHLLEKQSEAQRNTVDEHGEGKEEEEGEEREFEEKVRERDLEISKLQGTVEDEKVKRLKQLTDLMAKQEMERIANEGPQKDDDDNENDEDDMELRGWSEREKWSERELDEDDMRVRENENEQEETENEEDAKVKRLEQLLDLMAREIKKRIANESPQTDDDDENDEDDMELREWSEREPWSEREWDEDDMRVRENENEQEEEEGEGNEEDIRAREVELLELLVKQIERQS